MSDPKIKLYIGAEELYPHWTAEEAPEKENDRDAIEVSRSTYNRYLLAQREWNEMQTILRIIKNDAVEKQDEADAISERSRAALPECLQKKIHYYNINPKDFRVFRKEPE